MTYFMSYFMLYFDDIFYVIGLYNNVFKSYETLVYSLVYWVWTLENFFKTPFRFTFNSRLHTHHQQSFLFLYFSRKIRIAYCLRFLPLLSAVYVLYF